MAKRQTALQSDLRKLWRAVEQSPSTVVITDAKGDIEYVNPKFEELTGYTAKEVLGQNPRMLNSGKQPTKFYEEMWEKITAGLEWRGEFCNKKKNGEYYWEFASISAVRNTKGKITHYVAVKEDITARKKVEDQLKDAIQELQIKNDEIELAMKELKDTQIELIESARVAALGKLTAGLAHEINTPLGVLLSFIEVNGRCLQKISNSISNANTLEDVLNNEQYLAGIDTLQDSGRHSETAVNRIKEVVRCLKGFIHLDEAGRQMVDIHNGLEDTLTLLQHRIIDGVRVVKEFETIPLNCCNPAEINQVFLIVLSNAFDAIRGDGSISLRTYEEDGKIYVEISDNGMGIAPERQKKIFDFNFIEKGERTGFGFSLPSAMMVVRRHGGDIKVRSEVGKGSTFSIVLPIREI